MIRASPLSPRPRLALVTLAALALAWSSAARADDQPPEQPANVILADLGLHVIGLGYQRTVSPWLALQVDVESYTPWTQSANLLGGSPGYNPNNLSALDLTGWVIRFRPFFYGIAETPFPAGGPPTGFWLSPFGQFGLVTATRDGIKRPGQAWAVGLSGGWGWLFFDHLAVIAGAGFQYHVANIHDGTGAQNIYPPSFARLYPTVDLNVGFAF